MIWTLSASQRAYICMDYHNITTAQKTFHLEVGIFGQDTQTSQPLVLHCKLRASITKKKLFDLTSKVQFAGGVTTGLSAVPDTARFCGQ
jgi:hypothetical protein